MVSAIFMICTGMIFENENNILRKKCEEIDLHCTFTDDTMEV